MKINRFRHYRRTIIIIVLLSALIGAYVLSVPVVLPVTAIGSAEMARSTPVHARPAESLSVYAQSTYVQSTAEIDHATPLAMRLDGLIAMAQSGNREAAIRLFTDALKCTKYAKKLTALESIYNKRFSYSEEAWQHLTVDQLAGIENNVLEPTTNKEMKSLCEGMNSLDSDGSMFEISLLAARAGSRDAAACYVWAQFGMPPEQWIDETLFDNYKENSNNFILAGIKSGDWRFVILSDWVNNISYIDEPGTWFDKSSKQNYQASYESVLLERLGAADPEIMSALDKDAAFLSDKLTPLEIAMSDKRAREIYQQYFARGTKYSNKQKICDIY